MVYAESLDAFASGVWAMLEAQPERTRYSLKFDHAAAVAVAKVTDDRRCLKFRTRAQVDAKKLAALSRDIMAPLGGGERRDWDAEAEAAVAEEAVKAAATAGKGKGKNNNQKKKKKGKK